ncbi:MAG: hypothetical protein EOO11_11085 [Chitinophagaceae bacterium]|nr:MAG: hypothetical protein EOO11_11085 [Chitinophagaceae bacterium]
MDLAELFAQRLNDRIPAMLADGTWERSCYYRMETDDRYLGCPLLVRLDKAAAPGRAEALVYIFQRILATEGSWPAAGYPSGRAFLDALRAHGCVSETEARPLPAAAAGVWASLYAEIAALPGSRLTANGVPVDFGSLLQPGEVEAAFAFADDWNDRRYWLETRDASYFFGWAFAD